MCFNIALGVVWALIAFSTPAFAGQIPGPVSVPFDEGGLLGLIAAVIIGGIYLARRKR